MAHPSDWMGNTHRHQYDNDFEDYSYMVKNINRRHIKRVQKFKHIDRVYDDSL